MLVSLLIFALGGALSGAATGEGMLFAGRTVMGLGGGGVLTLSSIILSDIVALHERGLYNGILGLAWSAASGVGPVIGGSLAQTGQWRWLFYMNIPFAGAAAVFVLLFVKLPTPAGSLRSKLERVDWIGNTIVIGSTTAVVIGMTWGGVEYRWSSPQVLVPLCVGGVGLGVFLLYEALWAKHPLVPVSLIRNRTSLSGYIQTGLLSIPLTGLMYYLPVYYQACMDASPIASGIDVFGVAFTVAPMTIVSGAAITATKRYRPPIWLGWGLLMLGHGLLTTLKYDTRRARSIGFQVITGTGIGLVYSSTYFPVLAPLPVASNAPALALYVFLRSFAQVRRARSPRLSPPLLHADGRAADMGRGHRQHGPAERAHKAPACVLLCPVPCRRPSRIRRHPGDCGACGAPAVAGPRSLCWESGCGVAGAAHLGGRGDAVQLVHGGAAITHPDGHAVGYCGEVRGSDALHRWLPKCLVCELGKFDPTKLGTTLRLELARHLGAERLIIIIIPFT
ncbi:hypothetical protein AcV5_003966 [Taiwanofungus camphoratus]|nr:hypothetical protein AcV5_003966 [Antrodia cinnamomea]